MALTEPPLSGDQRHGLLRVKHTPAGPDSCPGVPPQGDDLRPEPRNGGVHVPGGVPGRVVLRRGGIHGASARGEWRLLIVCRRDLGLRRDVRVFHNFGYV